MAWATESPALNSELLKILRGINASADNEIYRGLAEILIRQIVYCQRLDSFHASQKLKKFQGHAKDTALSLVDPIKKILKLEGELKDGLRIGWFEDLRFSGLG